MAAVLEQHRRDTFDKAFRPTSVAIIGCVRRSAAYLRALAALPETRRLQRRNLSPFNPRRENRAGAEGVCVAR